MALIIVVVFRYDQCWERVSRMDGHMIYLLSSLSGMEVCCPFDLLLGILCVFLCLRYVFLLVLIFCSMLALCYAGCGSSKIQRKGGCVQLQSHHVGDALGEETVFGYVTCSIVVQHSAI